MAKRNEVGIWFKCYDDASCVMDKIGLSSRDLTRQLTGLVAGYVGLRSVISTVKDFGEAAMHAQESEALFTDSFGRNADAVRKWSQDLGTSLKGNQYAIREQVATYNEMFAGMGLAEQQRIQMAEGLTSLQRDISSRYNTSIEEAGLKLESYMSGSAETMRRYIGLVDEIAIKQYAIGQGWIKEGEELNQLGKTYARYNIMMERSKSAHGDLARTIDSATNSQRSAREQWDEIRVSIGESLLPTYQKTFVAIHDWLENNQSDVKAWAESSVASITWVAKTFIEIQDKIVGDRAEQWMRKTAEDRYRQEQGLRKIDTSQPFTGLDLNFDVMNGLNANDPYNPYAKSTKQEARIAEIQAQLRRENEDLLSSSKAKESAKLPGQYAMPDLSATYAPVAPGESLTGGSPAKRTEKYTDDMASAYRRMYGDIKRNSESAWAARRYLLNQELQENAKVVGSNAELWEWYYDKLESLQIEQGKASQSFYAGFRAEAIEMQRDLTTLGELGAGAATDVRDGFRTAFRDASAGALNLKKILTSIGTSFANRASDYAVDQVFSGIFAIGRGMGNAGTPKITAATPGAGGFHGFHRGGVPAYDRPAFTRLADLSIFDDAPRAHTGLGPGERPVIIKDEEGVFTPGQMRAMGGGSARVEALLGQMLDKLDAMERRPGVVVDYRNHLTAADVPAIVTDNRRRGGELSEF